MKYTDFLEKQNIIYNEFKDTSRIKIEGLKPNIEENKGGYVIVLRHPTNIINKINNVTSKIYKEVKCIKYDENNIHTTLAVYNQSIDFKADTKILDLIVNIAERNILLIKEAKIRYNECLMNENTVIVAGIPNENYIKYVDSLEKIGSENNINIKRSWGAHITIGRFLETIDIDKVLKLLDIVKDNYEIGISIPCSIDVGYFDLSKDTFKVNVYKSIKL